MIDLTGRTAVVTGGARGIGRATVERLASLGADVALLDLDVGSAEAVVEARGWVGDADVIALNCDVGERSDVERAMQEVVDHFGALDVLVNNAGVTRDNLIHKMSDDDWDTVINTHLRGGFLCSQVAQRTMVDAGYGRIVFLSSRAALGSRGQANYSAAKAGVRGLARSLAVELGRFGITSNVVVPGHIDTEMVRAAADRMGVPYEQLCDATIEKNAVKRVGDPRDVADAIAFLVSDNASYITGEVLHVTGRPPM